MPPVETHKPDETGALYGVFLDENLWKELARTGKTRLPRHGQAVTTGRMERWLRKLGITVPAYKNWSGERSLKAFSLNNPTWDYRAWAGLVLEHREDMMEEK